jgi:SAM-dependent methyltransferase
MSALFDGPGGAIAAAVMARMNRAAEAEAVELLAPSAGDRVLVLGYDPSAAMMAAATAANRGAIAAGRVRLLRATADAVPARNACFDSAVAVNTLQLCEPFNQVAHELARVLKRDARLVSFTHDWAVARHGGSTEAWLAQSAAALKDAGFAATESGRGRSEKGRIVRLTAVR